MAEQATTTQEAAVPLEYLEREICELSAQLAAATCKWLVLLAEFDRREGWGGWGLRSCAHWLNWRCGVSLVAAREHVRVARRLGELPAVHSAFAAGELSYSKVRALTRIANASTEAELVEMARHGTAAHVDRAVRAYRRADAADEDQAEEAERRHQARHLRWRWDEDGSLVIEGRLPPEDGAILLQALDAAQNALADGAEPQDTPAGASVGSDHTLRERRGAEGTAPERLGPPTPMPWWPWPRPCWSTARRPGTEASATRRWW